MVTRSYSIPSVIIPLQVLVEAVCDIERCARLCLEPLVPEDLDKLVSHIMKTSYRGLGTCESSLIMKASYRGLGTCESSLIMKTSYRGSGDL